MQFDTFLYGENYPIVKIDENENIDIWLESKINEAGCPYCGKICKCVHEKHSRTIQDTPIHNKNVFVHISPKEFKCTNMKCKIKTFTESLPFAGKNQVRTYALTEFILVHAIYLSSNCISLILSLLGVNVSADTVDNILKSVKIKDNPNVEMIGIDDVAIRKDMKYATAIYDLEDHHLIALLEGRNKEDIIPWLKKHPKIIVIARDRASAYAEAINEIYPEAVQIADRFHLFDNLTKYLKDLLYAEISNKVVVKDNEVLDRKATKIMEELSNIDETELCKLDYNNEPPVDKNGEIIDYIKHEYDLNDKLHKKQAENRIKKYNDVIHIREDSKKNSCNELAAKYGHCAKTIKKYLMMSDDEVKLIKEKQNYNCTKITEFSKYKNMAYKMLKDEVSYEYILAYIIKKGCTLKPRDLKYKLYLLAKNNKLDVAQFSNILYPKFVTSSDEHEITRNEILIASLSIKSKNNSKISSEEFKCIENKYPIVTKIKNIFVDFYQVIFGKDEELLDIFIEVYKNDIPSFCNGLKKDIAAVKNAISDEINSGFVEGNNKFKLIKRIVYGKQKLCNLFKRCYLAFASTLEDLTLLKLAIQPFVS